MPTVSALRERADAIVSQVLAENATRWESLSATDRERVEMLARAIANRLLHEPTVRLKGAADREDAYLQVSALRELFGLDAGTEPQDETGRSSAPPAERPRITGADIASLDERRRRSERG
jgi:glutamyl-tRNA reductase